MVYYTTKPSKNKHPGNTTNRSPPKLTREQQLVHTSVIMTPTSYARAHREPILAGDLPLPPHLVIGPDCKRRHGFNGKMLRTEANGACICCVQFKTRKPEEVTHKLARDMAEDRAIAKELWLDKKIGEDYPEIDT